VLIEASPHFSERLFFGKILEVAGVRLVIEGGTAVSPADKIEEKRNILIEEGIIKSFPSDAELPSIKNGPNVEIVNASGLIVSPGLIDMHVHLREPGEEHKETIHTGALAAVAGGYTSVACMPNTHPPNDNASVTRFIIEKAKEAALCRVYPVASITRGLKGEKLTDFDELKEAGAIALSDDGRPVANSNLMRRALEYAGALHLPVISHSEECSLSEGGVMHEGEVSKRLGLPGIPWAAEDVAVFRDVTLARLTGTPIHIAHVSTKGAVEIIRRAKAEGVQVTAETAPHYFMLTHEAVLGFNTHAKMNPPLRTEEDMQAVRAGLQDGTIDVIATDHAPHSPSEKNIEFKKAANGVIGLETALGLVLEMVRLKILSLSQALEKLTINPARILRIEGGTLAVGKPADITILDPDLEYKVEAASFKSLARNTPFNGWCLRGRAVATIIKGEVKWRLAA
jgi:dihydroorotase